MVAVHLPTLRSRFLTISCEALIGIFAAFISLILRHVGSAVLTRPHLAAIISILRFLHVRRCTAEACCEHVEWLRLAAFELLTVCKTLHHLLLAFRTTAGFRSMLFLADGSFVGLGEKVKREVRVSMMTSRGGAFSLRYPKLDERALTLMTKLARVLLLLRVGELKVVIV